LACLYKEGTLKAKSAELIRENFDEVTGTAGDGYKNFYFSPDNVTKN
jgi:hypothetical protein